MNTSGEVTLLEVKHNGAMERPWSVLVGRQQFGNRHFTESLRFTGKLRAVRVASLLAEHFVKDGWSVIIIKDGKETKIGGA